ncbi:hypothetical protein P5G86_23975 [Paenibacillus jamilae]|uniref:hypothetical protein n=1 Tax=Bacillus TaxID=1386 RepID=UPI000BF66D69|nr:MULTISPECIES: hypothetical protein [Bacillus cereus group]MCO4220200.1 hypothetical protein [Bacillus sp. 10017]MEB4843051.1 hypothetical protein [Paenibacillus jamilae]MCO4220402.1 hypothetical protein [Bacillus sp. 10017]MCR6856543.1 hypothetical protein [Bacillus thuringiensis]MEB8830952.1 hypothetical protein [Bacillus cereus]
MPLYLYIILIVLLLTGITYLAINPNRVWGKQEYIILVSLFLISITVMKSLGSDISTSIEKNNKQIKHNIKTMEELLVSEFNIPADKIYLEEKTKYYKVTTNTGIYKVTFRYDSQKNIIGIQKIDPILTVANEGGNHEQGSHNKN